MNRLFVFIILAPFLLLSTCKQPASNSNPQYIDSVYNYTLITAKAQKHLQLFGKKGIDHITYGQGHDGCFGSYSMKYVYSNNGNRFVPGSITTDMPKDTTNTFNGFEASLACELATRLNTEPQYIARVDQLGIEEEVYQQCRKDILAFQHNLANGTNIDNMGFGIDSNVNFTQLLTAMDQVKKIDSATLNKVLLHFKKAGASTLNDWIRLSITDSAHRVIQIANDYYSPTAFYLTWDISINSRTYRTTSPAITQFVKRAFPVPLKTDSSLPLLKELVTAVYIHNQQL